MEQNVDTREIVALARKCSEIAREVADVNAMNGIAAALLRAALSDQDPIGLRGAISAYEEPARSK